MNRRDFLRGGAVAATAMPLAGFGAARAAKGGAVGVAAALAARRGTTPRAVGAADIREVLKRRGVAL